MVMDGQQIANAAAVWVQAWLYGNARPQTVVHALERLAAQPGADTQSRAILEHAWRVLAGTPFGSVAEPVYG
jgi:hypothetical protein